MTLPATGGARIARRLRSIGARSNPRRHHSPATEAMHRRHPRSLIPKLWSVRILASSSSYAPPCSSLPPPLTSHITAGSSSSPCNVDEFHLGRSLPRFFCQLSANWCVCQKVRRRSTTVTASRGRDLPPVQFTEGIFCICRFRMCTSSCVVGQCSALPVFAHFSARFSVSYSLGQAVRSMCVQCGMWVCAVLNNGRVCL